MELLVDNTQQSIELGLTGIDEIVQNVKLILNTPKGSVPLDRDFGIDWSILDRPVNSIIPKLKAQVIKQIHKYEPRARVKKVTVEESHIADGELRIKVLLEVKEDAESQKLLTNK